jgi:hypothetical protein
MLKKFGLATVVVSAAMMAGCVTAPGVHTVQNTRTYQMSYDQTWENVVSFFASRNIQIKNIAKDSGVIYAEAARFDDSMADCGKPGIFQIVGRKANFNVFVKHAGNGTQVSVNTDFSETRRFENNVTTIQCNSYGTLENLVLNAASSTGGA